MGGGLSHRMAIAAEEAGRRAWLLGNAAGIQGHARVLKAGSGLVFAAWRNAPGKSGQGPAASASFTARTRAQCAVLPDVGQVEGEVA